MTSAEYLSLAANVSTVLAAVIALAAVLIGSYQFVAAQKSSREVNAVDLFLKFNQLSLDQSVADNTEADFWYNNSKLSVTESLYNIIIGIESWEHTVAWMLSCQAEFINEIDFCTNTYTKEFLSFLKAKGFELRSSD
jgi:hypothetical protein